MFHSDATPMFFMVLLSLVARYGHVINILYYNNVFPDFYACWISVWYNSILNPVVSSYICVPFGRSYVMTGRTSAVYNATFWSVHSGLLCLINGNSMLLIRRVVCLYFSCYRGSLHTPRYMTSVLQSNSRPSSRIFFTNFDLRLENMVASVFVIFSFRSLV